MAHSASDVLAVELLQREALLTVGGTRFISSKPVGRHAVSPLAASANAGATVNGNVSAPFLVPSSVHSAKAVNLQASVGDASAESASASGVLCSFAADCVYKLLMLSSSVVTGQLVQPLMYWFCLLLQLLGNLSRILRCQSAHSVTIDTTPVAFMSKMLQTIVLSKRRFHLAQVMLPFFILIDFARLYFSARSDCTCITPL